MADNRHIFKLYQPLYSLKGDVIGIISAMDQSGYYDELLGEIILNIFKVDFTAIFIFGIVFAVYVQKKEGTNQKISIFALNCSLGAVMEFFAYLKCLMHQTF